MSTGISAQKNQETSGSPKAIPVLCVSSQRSTPGISVQSCSPRPNANALLQASVIKSAASTTISTDRRRRLVVSADFILFTAIHTMRSGRIGFEAFRINRFTAFFAYPVRTGVDFDERCFDAFLFG